MAARFANFKIHQCVSLMLSRYDNRPSDCRLNLCWASPGGNSQISWWGGCSSHL